jgi:uncharacterized protein YkwD
MKKMFAITAVFLPAFLAVFVFTSCRSAPLPGPEIIPVVYACSPQLQPFEPHEFELRVFELTNLERARQRLPALIWYQTASCVAREHSRDMESNNIMRPRGSDGSDSRQRLERAGITNMRFSDVNIAGGWLTPEEVVTAWMDSPRHRPNILSREFTHLGVGFFQRPTDSNARFATYWTQKFFVFD